MALITLKRVSLTILCVCSRPIYSFISVRSTIHRSSGVLNAITARSGSLRTRPSSSSWLNSEGAHRRHKRMRLHGSIRANREKIERARSKLRAAMRAGQSEDVDRIRAYIMHLRKRDPQFAAEDAMHAALSKGLFSAAAKFKLRLEEVKQNPFRESLLDNMSDYVLTGGQPSQRREEDEHQHPPRLSLGNDQNDVGEDMSWGFDHTFFQQEKANDDEDQDYDDI